MKIEVETDKCIGAGVCAMAAPDVFDQRDEDGVVVVLEPQPGDDRSDAVRDAAARCPAAVIRLSA
ncbi:ferredoxin [Glycomyces sp. MUSA5-2]|uniref:ferredoxin n=1 Tax=Glycomyces sp. MUSA5-2 TaxID=2053002 RepID=UPI003008CF6F